MAKKSSIKISVTRSVTKEYLSQIPPIEATRTRTDAIQNSPKRYFGPFLLEKLLSRTFKNRPVWSHMKRLLTIFVQRCL